MAHNESPYLSLCWFLFFANSIFALYSINFYIFGTFIFFHCICYFHWLFVAGQRSGIFEKPVVCCQSWPLLPISPPPSPPPSLNWGCLYLRFNEREMLKLSCMILHVVGQNNLFKIFPSVYFHHINILMSMFWKLNLVWPGAHQVRCDTQLLHQAYLTDKPCYFAVR